MTKFGRWGKPSPLAGVLGSPAQSGAVWAVVAITLELVGPVPIVWGRFIWLAADRLTVLTLIASLVANDFWNLSGQAQFMALNSFFEHMGLIADLVMAALVAEHAKRRDG